MNLDPFDPANLVRGVIATVVLASVIAYFTRATLRRIAGALVGSLPLIPMVMLYDIVAARLGLWRYPSMPGEAPGPFGWYIAAALLYGAALGLVGWRVIRRYGRRGLIGFLLALAAFGVTRDYIFSRTMGGIVFGPGLLPVLADLFAYASPAAVVQLVMYWISGPAGSDPLARTRHAPIQSVGM
jgi:uncharacterized membrane protein